MKRFAIQKLFDIPITGRHRGLSTIYNDHNLFQQSKLGREELQNTHIALFKSPRDQMQVNMLSAQLGLRSELVYWYRDATSVSYGHLLIELSPRTDDRLRYCTNPGSIHSKLYSSERLKHLKSLDDEHTKSLYSPSVQIVFPQMQQSFPSVLLKKFIRFLCEFIVNLLKENPTSSDKIPERGSITLFEKNNLEAKKSSGNRKKFTAQKKFYSSRH